MGSTSKNCQLVRIDELENLLKQIVCTIKEIDNNINPEFIPGITPEFITNIENVLNKKCDHVWGIKTENYKMPFTGSLGAACIKCGTSPSPYKGGAQHIAFLGHDLRNK